MSNPYLPQSPASTLPTSPRTPAGPSSQPVTRSRTLFYLSIRDSSVTPRRGPRRSAASYGLTNDIAEEDEGLLRGHTVEMGLPPKWVDASDEVEEILGRAKGKIAALDKLHAKHVLPGFTDRTAEEREIERQTSDITKDFRRCTALIGAIQPSRGAARAEITTAKNVQRGLAQKVQDMSAQFRKKQRVYMQKLQGHAIKNKDLLAASGAITLKGSDVLDELQEDEQASRTQLQSQTQSQATTALNIDLDARTNEITQIATSISELADLFRDLGNLVVEQGTVLDSVEYNVQQTARELVAAEGELKEAQRYQANTGRRKCILFLILIIVGLIIVLIYKPRGGDRVVVPGESEGGVAASAVDAMISATATATDTTPSTSTSTSTRHRYRPRPSLGQYTTGEAVTVPGGANPTVSRGRLPLPKPPPLPTRPIDGEAVPLDDATQWW